VGGALPDCAGGGRCGFGFGGFGGVRLGVAGDEPDVTKCSFYQSGGARGRLDFACDDRQGLCLDGFHSDRAETILSSMEATKINLTSPELAQTVPVGLSILPEPSGLVDFSEGSESVSAPVLPVPKAQLLVNGLIEAQAWYLGWLRDGTQSREMLAAIDCFEVQMRRKNEVAPPLVCSMELSKLKAALEAGTRDINRETVVRSLALLGCKPCPH
jgi:hypothetical protein